MGRIPGFLHHLRSSELNFYGTLQSLLTTILGFQIDATSSGVIQCSSTEHLRFVFCLVLFFSTFLAAQYLLVHCNCLCGVVFDLVGLAV